MVVREDEVLAELRGRLGENFGLKKALREGYDSEVMRCLLVQA